ncbi:9559_t:CDS:2 [Diversispora eburnea]|uniref:9559_t:CDS:1 n=1 Tax=Diversispora eburnea TaxID=1213867 RepID=A0A9N8UW38_9GLOM|nr:9559_t:CDS:2 [Diversispora eburnea]
MTTNNGNIIKSITSKQLPHRMLIYTGPLARNMIHYKRLALFFCFLGFLMAPTIATYVSRLFINVPSEIWYNPKMRKTFDPKKIDPISVNPTLYMEIQNWSGRIKGQTVKLNELREYKGLNSWVTWIRISENNNNNGGGRNTKFFVEKKQLRQDPFSKGLMEFIEKRSVD